MKTIGIIGGMSWESSKVYYEYLNRMVGKRLGSSHSARIIMSSVDFAEIEKLSFQNDWDKIGVLMAKHAAMLEKAGAHVIVLATNTIHMVEKHIKEVITIPFLHIATATGEAIVKQSIKKIGLLGTQFTMERDFYTKKLEQEFGLEVCVPNKKERAFLQDLIYNELVKGQFTQEAKTKCVEIIKNLENKGAEGIILGCTELPILIRDNAVSLPLFNTTEIHATKAVDFALN